MSTITTSHPLLPGPRDAFLRDRDGVAALSAVHRHLDLTSELLELVDRGGTLQVGGNQPRRLALVLSQVQRELGARRRLARSLQATDEDDGRRTAEDELRVGVAHERGQLLVDDLDDLLSRVEALEHVVAESARAYTLDEALRDLEVDVRLEQREADLAHRLRDRLLVEPLGAPDVAEHRLQPP